MGREGWQQRRLGDISSFLNGDRGHNYPSRREFVETGIPFINAGHLRGGGVDFSSMNYVTRHKYEALGGGKVERGDILYCIRGSLGKAALTENTAVPGAIASSLVIIRPSADANARFLFLMLTGPWGQAMIRRLDNGSAQPNISANSLQDQVMELPGFPEQRQIAEILDTLDEAIRKTESIIAKLRQVKHGLLIDLLTRGIDDNGELRDPERHPEQFKDSPLGRIPNVWEVQPASVVCEAVIDCKNRTPPATGSGHPVIRTPNVREGEFVPAGLTFTDPSSYEIWTQRGKPRAGDVLITREAPVGEVCLLPQWLSPACLGQRMMMYRPDSTRLHNEFMVVALQSRSVQKVLIDWAGGSTVGHVRVGDIRRLPVPVPPLPEQYAIADVWRRLRERLRRESRSLDKWQVLKHGLMEDLLSGQVRVTSLLEQAAQ